MLATTAQTTRVSEKRIILMSPLKKQRLLFISISMISMGLGVTLFLMFFRNNIVYFYSPSELYKQFHAQPNANNNISNKRSIRIGGLVETGSVQHDDCGIEHVRFVVTDGLSSVAVTYQGGLPDLFREGQGVVVEGQLQPDNTFKASRVLAKHDENYMPPEVKNGLDAVHKEHGQRTLQP